MLATMIVPLALFAFVNSVTPGPNNVMLTASGANFGYRRSLPHMMGITVGAGAMLIVVGAGLGEVFTAVPAFYTTLKYVGVIYLLYLAWRIANAGEIKRGDTRARPIGFWQAAAFQWVNPKAWIMTVGIAATYTPRDGFMTNLLTGAVVLMLVNFPSISVWTLFGSALRSVLSSPSAIRNFNWTMAALLIASLYPIVA